MSSHLINLQLLSSPLLSHDQHSSCLFRIDQEWSIIYCLSRDFNFDLVRLACLFHYHLGLPLSLTDHYHWLVCDLACLIVTLHVKRVNPLRLVWVLQTRLFLFPFHLSLRLRFVAVVSDIIEACIMQIKWLD